MLVQQFNRQISSRVLQQKSYILIGYAYKLNYIFMIAMKDSENKSMIAAYEEVSAKLEARGQRPKLNILDNECSKCIQNYLEGKSTRHHHVAPHAHRVNAAKPAVKTAIISLGD